MSHSYAEINKTKGKKDAQFYFTIKSSGNNKVLATSEMYESKQAAFDGIAAVYTIKGNVFSKADIVDKTK